MRTFGTYVVTINLFSLHLMNFMLHAMLDATGVVLRLHYKSMKCDVLFSQGILCTIFRWGGHFSYMSTKIYSSLQQCKNYKNRSRLSKVMVTNVLPPFYGSQCTLISTSSKSNSDHLLALSIWHSMSRQIDSVVSDDVMYLDWRLSPCTLLTSMSSEFCTQPTMILMLCYAGIFIVAYTSCLNFF